MESQVPLKNILYHPYHHQLFLHSGTHNIQTGEKVIILSDDGDLPENIVENTVYYAIRHSSTQIKLASSESSAVSG
jgi:hypothetical protein